MFCALAASVGAQRSIAVGTSDVTLDGSDWQLFNSNKSTHLTSASVPGGIWDNLHLAGIIGDPLYRDNDLRFINATTAFPGGWTFQKRFATPAAASPSGAQ